MALIVAGDRSGVGKTTVTLAILAYLAAQSDRVQSFKVGPDYIDPMFHRAVTRLPCRNLDPFLTSSNYVRACFQRHAANAEWVVVEGVMGLFDGINNPEESESLNDYGSTAHIARLLNLPVLLVLDCSRLSTSTAAIAYGYANLDPQIKIAGVILNKVASDRHQELLETALNSIRMPVLGVLRRNVAVTIPDRHLGLIPEVELPDINRIFDKLAHLAQTSFNWKRLSPLIKQSPRDVERSPKGLAPRHEVSLGLPVSLSPSPPVPQPPIKIAIARDSAFNFYYQDNLDILTELGAELVFWSPLKDRKLPSKVCGLYFGGGFPEMFARQLADNLNLIKQIRQAIEAGIPTYAECGGLMYLCQQLIDLEGQAYSMVGMIPSIVTMQSKLTLGYRQATALQDSCLTSKGQIVKGHEFHRSQLTAKLTSFQWQLQGVHRSSMPTNEGWNIHQLHASYLHLHWGEAKFLPQQFIQCCRNYKTSLY